MKTGVNNVTLFIGNFYYKFSSSFCITILGVISIKKLSINISFLLQLTLHEAYQNIFRD